MNPTENSSAVLLGHPYQLVLLWWGAASQAMQTFWVAHKAASTCVDRLGRASLSVGVSALWPVPLLASVPASPATPPLVPNPEQPVIPHPRPDPIPPEISDPPPVEVPQPMHEPPVMPPPVAEETHAVFGDGETDDEQDDDARDDKAQPEVPRGYIDGALVTAGATEAESSPETAAGASAPLSKPALETAPRDEDGPLISEADPTSNAG